MTELFEQAAASAASVPSFLQLADIGFATVRNARIQRTLSEMEIERAFRRQDRVSYQRQG